MHGYGIVKGGSETTTSENLKVNLVVDNDMSLSTLSGMFRGQKMTTVRNPRASWHRPTILAIATLTTNKKQELE